MPPPPSLGAQKLLRCGYHSEIFFFLEWLKTGLNSVDLKLFFGQVLGYFLLEAREKGTAEGVCANESNNVLIVYRKKYVFIFAFIDHVFLVIPTKTVVILICVIY